MPRKVDAKLPQSKDLEELRDQLAKYHNDIRKFLDGYEAAIETSKFSVEQRGDGLAVEVAVKAVIQPKKKRRAK